MKTNKFESTIRRKLESIQPDFQEQDWAKMQQFMQANTPPTFWQQYGSWVGYAAAASVSTVMAFLYVNQLSQNDHLVADVKNLKSQIEVIQNKPSPAAKTDTIYLVQKESVIEPHHITPGVSENREEIAFQEDRQNRERSFAEPSYPKISQQVEAVDESTTPVDNQHLPYVDKQELAVSSISESNLELNAENSGRKSFSSGNQGNLYGGSAAKILGQEFISMNMKGSLDMNSGYSMSRKMNYELASRLSSRQVQRALNPGSSQGAAANAHINKTQIAAATASEKKVEQATKAENVIPKLNIKAPYRFGAGITMDGNGNSKTVVGEVIVARKFSITTGITWLKTKPMEFFTEKIFREKNRQDFKRSHPGEVPLAFDVYNIKVNPSLVQIPLTVAFRNNMKDNWAYFAGVGTNVNISSREKVSFDCKAPKGEFFSQGFDKKTDMPLVNSVNFSMGIEKIWHPIVVQAEGYLYTYFQPLTPLSHSAGPGLKVKLLYQIGGKM